MACGDYDYTRTDKCRNSAVKAIRLFSEVRVKVTVTVTGMVRDDDDDDDDDDVDDDDDKGRQNESDHAECVSIIDSSACMHLIDKPYYNLFISPMDTRFVIRRFGLSIYYK